MLIYGVCISDIEKVNEEKTLEFLKELSEKGRPYYLEDFLENKEDDEDYSISDWLDDFESNSYFGLSAFLKEVMRDFEGLKIDCRDPDGIDYLGISANTPWGFTARTKHISQEEFHKIISEYINKVCDDELEIKWWSHNE